MRTSTASRFRTAALLGALALFSSCEEKPPPIDPKVHAEGLYVHATALYLAGRFDEALEAYGQVKKILPNDPRLPAAFGEVYLAQSKLNEALAQFEEAAKLEPRRSTNWSRIGFIQTQLGKAEEARSALRKAVGLNPRDHIALESLGDLDFREGKVEGAVSSWALAAEASPTADQAGQLWVRAARELVKVDRGAQALALLEKASKEGDVTSDVLAEYGEQLVRHQRFDDAVSAYTRAAQKNPNDPGLWELVGELYRALDKPGDAIAAFRESLKVKDRAVVHVALARMYKARNEEAAAQEALNRALETASGEEAREAHELARLLRDFGRKPDALKLFEAIAAEPENATDAALQVETATLARELGAQATVTTACARAFKADAAIKKCP